MTADEIWQRVLQDATSSSAQATVDGLRVVAYRDGVLKLDQIDPQPGGVSPTRQEALGRLVERVIGRSVKIEVVRKSDRVVDKKALEPMENQPEVRAVLREFDAVVVEVEDSKSASRKKETE